MDLKSDVKKIKRRKHLQCSVRLHLDVFFLVLVMPGFCWFSLLLIVVCLPQHIQKGAASLSWNPTVPAAGSLKSRCCWQRRLYGKILRCLFQVLVTSTAFTLVCASVFTQSSPLCLRSFYIKGLMPLCFSSEINSKFSLFSPNGYPGIPT